MELYAYDGPMDVSVLKEFCKSRKQVWEVDAFFFLVIFDKAENARFPKDAPFTALYGVVEDEDALRHIRAIYTYNPLNGFSEVEYFSTNMWDGRRQTVKIP